MFNCVHNCLTLSYYVCTQAERIYYIVLGIMYTLRPIHKWSLENEVIQYSKVLIAHLLETTQQRLCGFLAPAINSYKHRPTVILRHGVVKCLRLQFTQCL